MTLPRTVLTLVFLLMGVCHAQSSSTPPNGSFGFSFSFIEVDGASAEPKADEPAPDNLKCWLVGVVVPGSPAAQAGIKPGDKILYVDAQPATKQAYNYLKLVSTADFLIQRADQTIFSVMSLHRAFGLNFGLPPIETEQLQAIDGYLKIEGLLGHKSTGDTSIDDFFKKFFGDTAASSAAVEKASRTSEPLLQSNVMQDNQRGDGNKMANASNAAIVGTWAGGKSEHDYLHGGYVSADWTFTFSPSGTYEEEVYVGGQEAMSAGGTYIFAAATKPGDRTVTNMLTFHPGSAEYTNNDLARVAASFPVPIKAVISEYVNFFRLADGNTMMLQDAVRSGSESWQMKAR